MFASDTAAVQGRGRVSVQHASTILLRVNNGYPHSLSLVTATSVLMSRCHSGIPLLMALRPSMNTRSIDVKGEPVSHMPQMYWVVAALVVWAKFEMTPSIALAAHACGVAQTVPPSADDIVDVAALNVMRLMTRGSAAGGAVTEARSWAGHP